MRTGREIAVVGAGIAGLAAALRLRDRAPSGTRITVYDQAAVPGGKLRTGALVGSTVEYGAEAFLTLDPAGGDSTAVELARRVGLGDALVHPAVGQAAVAVEGRLIAVPPGTLVGVPGDLAVVAAVARPAAERDLDGGRPLLAAEEDVAVGALVRRRLGDEVVDRLVDPMLGGVYAGRADDLSLAATMPALVRACRTEHTLAGAVRAALRAMPRRPGTPIFATVLGGVGRLVEAVAAASGATLRLGLPVRSLAPSPSGWRLVVGSARDACDAREVRADAVVLAVPARPAARLLSGVHSGSAGLVGELEYASVALVTLAVPAPSLPALSGFLVPAADGTAVKAATFFTTKWAHLRRDDGVALVRASLGRHGEEHVIQPDDATLVSTVHSELARLLGDASLPAPVDAHVQRWGGALPQYRPGHIDRVARARAGLRAAHPTLALAGAAYDGVGIPICIRSGWTAADDILKALGDSDD